MSRRAFIKSIAALSAVGLLPKSWATGLPANRFRIAFGSCCRQDKDQSVWHSIAAKEPDVFVHLGDTVYHDKALENASGIITALEDAYRKQSSNSDFQAFRNTVPILSTWDDHDYGLRDGGADFKCKEETRQLYLDFWGAPKNDPRRIHQDGLYYSEVYSVGGDQIQFLLLDPRFERSNLRKAGLEEQSARRTKGLGPYVPNLNPDAHVLGKAQWQWLAAQLKVPASLRVVCSGIQVLAEDRGWECWENFPREKRKLLTSLQKRNGGSVIFLSGDVHYAEASVQKISPTEKWYDLTSSGLTHFWHTAGPNNRRVGQPFNQENFGILDVALENNQVALTFMVFDKNGQMVRTFALL